MIGLLIPRVGNRFAGFLANSNKKNREKT